MDPFRTDRGRNNSLRAQNDAVLVLVGQLGQLICHGGGIEGRGGLGATAHEYLVGMVMMMVIAMAVAFLTILVVVMVMLMLVLMAVAFLTVLVVVMVMLMLVLVAMALLTVLVVVMVMLMLVLVAMALLTFLVVVMVMLMLMLVAMAFLTILVVVMVMLMLMLVLVAVALLTVLVVVMVLFVVVIEVIVVMMMVVMMLRFLGQTCQLGLQSILALHGFAELSARQLIPRSRHNDSGGIMLPQERNSGLNLLRRGSLGVGENNATGILHLVIEELTKVLHVHLALTCIHHGGEATQNGPLGGGALYGADDVRELAHARGLNENAVGGVLGQHLGQSLAEITYQGATDATRIHLVDLDTRLGQKAAVDTDLAELVLDQHQLLAGVGLGDELLDQGSFAGTQKAGENVNLCHGSSLL